MRFRGGFYAAGPHGRGIATRPEALSVVNDTMYVATATAMPEMEIPEPDIRDISAYLYRLR